MKFEILQDEPNEPFIFHLTDDNKTLLIGPPYVSQDECTAGMRDAIQRLTDRENIDVREWEDGFIYLLQSETGEELGRSEIFSSRESASAAASALIGEAGNMAEYEVNFTKITTREVETMVRLSGSSRTAVLYDFSRTSQSGKAGFELLQAQGDGDYFFHFNGEDGQALLYSREFDHASARADRIRSVIKNAKVKTRYEQQQEGGEHFFILKARNGREIARSRSFSSVAELEAAIAFLRLTVKDHQEEFVREKKERSTASSNQYNLALASAAGVVGFDALRGKDGKDYFIFNDDSGEALLFSQGYSAKRGRDNGLRAVIKNAAEETRYTRVEENGRYHFVLKAGNWEEIARSRDFESREEMDNAIAFLMTSIPTYAAAYGVQLKTVVTQETNSMTLAVNQNQAGAAPPAGTITVTEESPSGNRSCLWIGAILAVAILALLYFLLTWGGSNDAQTGEEPQTASTSTLAPLGSTDSSDSSSSQSQGENAEASDDSIDGEARGVSNAPTGESVIDADSATDETNRGTTDGDATDGDATDGDATSSTLGFVVDSMAGLMEIYLNDSTKSADGRFIMDKVRFGLNSAKLNKGAYPQIENLAKLLKAYPNTRIEIQGHIDGGESDAYSGPYGDDGSITLSAIRARCIYKKLIARGIPAHQMEFHGFGSARPAMHGEEEGDRQDNRRLEIVVRATGTTEPD